MGTCTALNVFLTLYACLLINSPSCLHQKNLSAHQTKFIYFFILSMYLYNVLYTYIHTQDYSSAQYHCLFHKSDILCILFLNLRNPSKSIGMIPIYPF